MSIFNTIYSFIDLHNSVILISKQIYRTNAVIGYMSIIKTTKDGILRCPVCISLQRRNKGILYKRSGLVINGEDISYTCNNASCDFMIRTKNLWSYKTDNGSPLP